MSFSKLELKASRQQLGPLFVEEGAPVSSLVAFLPPCCIAPSCSSLNMGEIANRKAWHQDPKLQLCTLLPDLELVLEKVRLPRDVTPGLLSHLYRTNLPSFIRTYPSLTLYYPIRHQHPTHSFIFFWKPDAGKRKLNHSDNPNDLACLGEDAIGSDLHNRLLSSELNLVRKPNSFVGLKVRPFAAPAFPLVLRHPIHC